MPTCATEILPDAPPPVARTLEYGSVVRSSVFVVHFLLDLVLAVVAPRAALVAENLLLRQQLIVARRRVKRPGLRRFDRWLLGGLGGRSRRLLDAVLLVEPETVIRWHRAGWRLFWRWRSRRPPGRPPIDAGARRFHPDRAQAPSAAGRQNRSAPPSAAPGCRGRPPGRPRRAPAAWRRRESRPPMDRCWRPKPPRRSARSAPVALPQRGRRPAVPPGRRQTGRRDADVRDRGAREPVQPARGTALAHL